MLVKYAKLDPAKTAGMARARYDTSLDPKLIQPGARHRGKLSCDRKAGAGSGRRRAVLMSRPVWFAAVGLIVAGAIVLLVRAFVPAGAPAPDFTLTDQDGKPYTLSAHRGRPIALFFGYAHCPDVCPTTFVRARARETQTRRGCERVRRRAGNGRSEARRSGNAQALRALVRSRVHRTSPEPKRSSIPSMRSTMWFTKSTAAERARTGTPSRTRRRCSSSLPTARLRGTGDWSDSPDDLATLMRQAQS